MSARKNALSQKMKPKTQSTRPATLDARSGMKRGEACWAAAAMCSETGCVTAEPRASDPEVAQRVNAHEHDEEQERPDSPRSHDLESTRRRVGGVEAHAGQEEAAEARLLRPGGHPPGLRAIERLDQGLGGVGDAVQIAAHAAVSGEDHERRLVPELARLRVVLVPEPHRPGELVHVVLRAHDEAPRARNSFATSRLMDERLLVAVQLRERVRGVDAHRGHGEALAVPAKLAQRLGKTRELKAAQPRAARIVE